MADAFEGKLIAEKYKLGSLLRSGEHGDLYDARHILMDKQVSVRILRPSLAADQTNVERFFADAKIASKISDPNVLNLSDFGTDRDGNVYAVYEPVTGKTLKDVIREDGAFPVHSSIEAARQIAWALAASHNAGQIHGNLTADNVLLTGSEGISVKVFDFGSANPIDTETTDADDFAYLAPEQCAGAEHADKRGDIYSVGVILYEMLAGVPPFVGEKPTDVMLKHIEEPPSPLVAFRGDLPDSIEPVILKALSKNPDMRQQTASEFADELETATSGLDLSTPAKNNLWKTAFIVLFGIAALAAFLIYGTSVRRTDPTTVLQPDANGLPVQPINPATGIEEQTLASMPGMIPGVGNSNMAQPPGTLPGGDNYNPWATGAPPPGAPYIPPGGQVYTVDPATGSPFMPPDGGVILVPVPANTNTNTARPTPTPKPPTANANTQVVPKPTPASVANTPQKPPANTPSNRRPATNRSTRTPSKTPNPESLN